MTDIDLAYAGGFFDGEGCVYHHPRGSYLITITQKDREILDEIQEMIGGVIDFRDYSYSHPHHVLRISGKAKVERACLALIPHSRVKKAQLIQALNWAQSGHGGIGKRRERNKKRHSR